MEFNELTSKNRDRLIDSRLKALVEGLRKKTELMDTDNSVVTAGEGGWGGGRGYSGDK